MTEAAFNEGFPLMEELFPDFGDRYNELFWGMFNSWVRERPELFSSEEFIFYGEGGNKKLMYSTVVDMGNVGWDRASVVPSLINFRLYEIRDLFNFYRKMHLAHHERLLNKEALNEFDKEGEL